MHSAAFRKKRGGRGGGGGVDWTKLLALLGPMLAHALFLS